VKIKHIKRSADFVSVIKSGKRLTKGRISLSFTKSPGPGGLAVGIVISKKTEPLATRRNYMRRLVYSFCSEKADMIKNGVMAVVRVDKSTRGIKKKSLSAEIKEALGQLLLEVAKSA
jgi:ribonuclease P protein component